ncbi:MAG: hypothetical protein ACPG8H_06455 [Candidatus Thalassarchaeaceae archaeon]
MSTIGLFDFQALHLSFSGVVAILSTMEREQFVRPTCRVVWSESSGLPHGAIHEQMCACTMLHLATVQDAIQS